VFDLDPTPTSHFGYDHTHHARLHIKDIGPALHPDLSPNLLPDAKAAWQYEHPAPRRTSYQCRD